ncbi:MAG: hypothetical protein KDB16_01085 [Acidimicrobiales bacterium]|nr:hypothetical protein [Acidimicrobiales bacterium]
MTADEYWAVEDVSAPVDQEEATTRASFGLREIDDPAVFAADPEAAFFGVNSIGARLLASEASKVAWILESQQSEGKWLSELEKTEWYAGGEWDLERGTLTILVAGLDTSTAVDLIREAVNVSGLSSDHIGTRAVAHSLRDLRAVAVSLKSVDGVERIQLDIAENEVLVQGDLTSEKLASVLKIEQLSDIGVRFVPGAPITIDTSAGCDSTVSCYGYLRGGTGIGTPSGICSIAFPIRFGLLDAYMLTAKHCAPSNYQTITSGFPDPVVAGNWGTARWNVSWTQEMSGTAGLDVTTIPWPDWHASNHVYRCASDQNYKITGLVNYTPTVGTWVSLSAARSSACRGAEFKGYIDDVEAPSVDLPLAWFDRATTVLGDSGGLWHIGSKAFAVAKAHINAPGTGAIVDSATAIDIYMDTIDPLGGNSAQLRLIDDKPERLSNTRWNVNTAGWTGWPDNSQFSHIDTDDGYADTGRILIDCSNSYSSCSLKQDVGVWVEANRRIGLGAHIRCASSSSCPITLAVWSGYSVDVRFVSTSIPAGARVWVNTTVSFPVGRTGLRFELYSNNRYREVEVSDPTMVLG